MSLVLSTQYTAPVQTVLSAVFAIVVVAVEQGYMRAAEATPLVFAGVPTVVFLPAGALRVIGASGRGANAGDDRDGL